MSAPTPLLITGSEKKKLNPEIRKILKGVAFISPWVIGFLSFTIYPLLASFYYSFTDFSLFGSPKWIGLTNYIKLFDDPKFYKSLGNTLIFSVFIVPASIILAMGLAILLNNKLRGNSIYRTIIFMPSVVPAVASAVVWIWILNPQWGLLNGLLRFLNINGPPWLSSADWAKPALLIVTLWMIGSDMVLYLAGLQEIPLEYYEAAELDGASGWQKALNITVPLLTPIMFFHLVNAFIWSFQYFSIPFIVSIEGSGRPADSLLFYSLYLYQNAFRYLKMGYASAMAWMLFLLVMLCTFFILKSSKRWVNYGN
jgi:multiple sugar transport system permease protein